MNAAIVQVGARSPMGTSSIRTVGMNALYQPTSAVSVRHAATSKALSKGERKPSPKMWLFGNFPVIIHWLVCVKDREAEGAFRTKTQLGEHWARWG